LEFDELNLPNLTTLGSNAFYNVTIKKWLDMGKITEMSLAGAVKTALEELVIPQTVTKIGANVLENLTALTSLVVELPNLATIGNYAFKASAVTEVKDLGVITALGAEVFMNCKALRYVVLPETLTSISTKVFQGATALEYMIIRATIPPTLASTSAFTSTNNCPIYVPDESVEAYKTATNWTEYASRIYPMSDLIWAGKTTLEFEDPAVEAIALANWDTDGDGVMSKDEVKAVTSIGTKFKGNTEITSFNELELFTGVTSLDAEAFNGCTNLNYASLKNIRSTGIDALKNTNIHYVDAPYLTAVNRYAFTETPALVSVNIPLCTQILQGGFYMSNLQSIKCDNVEKIEDYGLKDTGIRELSLPKVNSIGKDAVNLCSSLIRVDIGDSITSIGNFAFGNNTSLDTVIIRATTPPTAGRLIFENTGIDSGSGYIYVPDASVADYKAATNWVTYANRIKPLSEFTE
jgi:hypothetical protein